MLKYKYITIVSLVCLLTFSSLKADSDIGTLSGYFDLLVSGNTESAYYHWTDECRERAARFGITYDNIPLKIDCYSPIVKDIDLMREHLQPPAKKTAKMPRGFSNLLYSSIVNGNLTEYTYYMRNIDNYFWLTFPQNYYSIDWETKQTKYFNIRYHSTLESNLNEIGLAEADRFIEKMAKDMNLSDDVLELIAEKKIEYFYCESDKQVEQITGHLVKGTYDMPSNDIISAFFPHHHEIVHLLTNIKLKSLPLYSLPILREGTAVYFGGRWGKAPNTLASIGEFLISEDIISIDSILAFSDFQKVATSNIAYSVSGLFSGYLIDRIGVDNYFELYKNFCGSADSLNSLSAKEIKQSFAQAVNKSDWAELQTDFRSYLDNVVAHSYLQPGLSEKGEEIYNADGLIIKADKEFYSFEISAMANDTVMGNILFENQAVLDGKRSILFEEQYKVATEFAGYRFGVRYDRNEVGVYDYATNHLIAKYIWSLQPSDAYFDDKNHKLYFKFKKEVLSSKLNKKTEFVILPN